MFGLAFLFTCPCRSEVPSKQTPTPRHVTTPSRPVRQLRNHLHRTKTMQLHYTKNRFNLNRLTCSSLRVAAIINEQQASLPVSLRTVSRPNYRTWRSSITGPMFNIYNIQFGTITVQKSRQHVNCVVLPGGLVWRTRAVTTWL